MNRKMVLYKGTAFKSCFRFTILGLVFLLLLHYVRIAAVVYSLLTYGVLPETVLLLAFLSLGTDVSLFFLGRSLITQLSYLLGSYRISDGTLILRFPLWGEMICRPEEIARTELCHVCCFLGGKQQKVLRILLKGFSSEDEDCFFFRNTGAAQRKKAILFVEPIDIQPFLQAHGIQIENRG